ncbi:EAL domain-containing response regulator [Catenovulum sediminis]|uniref:EAL domain-containing response regulator n=1 Tax=Catenovulum sediminis TaxID=1740262 RepID=UPI00117D4B2B|nr:EAL domain-containing protein [Catenovulum sediminis]
MKNASRVILVEDDRVTRELIAGSLEVYGNYHISAYDNMTEAYNQLLSERFDLALLDIGLPDGSGVDLLRLIREHDTPISLPVIIISGSRNNKQIVACLKLGANDFIGKPIDIEILIARIQNLLIIRQLDEDINKANERFTLAAKGSNDGLWDWFISSGDVYFSNRWKNMLGYDASEFQNEFDAFLDRIHPDDLIEFNRSMRFHLEGISNNFEKECRIKHKDGSYRWMMIRGAAIRHENGKAYRMAGSMTDITNRKIIDPLTNTLNRSAFLDRLEVLIQSTLDNQIKRFSVIMIAIDRYKLISDSYGHHFGDTMVYEVANNLSAIIPPSEVLARVDTDKFAITVQNPQSLEAIKDFLEHKIMLPLRVPLVINDREIHLTFSASVLYDTDSYTNACDMLRDADIALHNAWLLGNQQINVFQPKLQISLKDKVELEEDLHRAIEQDELDVYFQPKVNASGQIQGAEALVRWQHPVRGVVSPIEFIPLAEETGLINKIGYRVIKLVCQCLENWHTKNIQLPVAVNLSARQFLNPSLLKEIWSNLNTHSVMPELLELEVTESLLLENLDAALPVLNSFHQDGIKVSIDDFGTGYSSLAYLKTLPLSTLKIDRSFIKDLPQQTDDCAIVEAIAFIAKALKLQVVAEGVETIEQLKFLSTIGITVFQGYYFYKPMPVLEFERLLVAQSQSKSAIKESTCREN